MQNPFNIHLIDSDDWTKMNKATLTMFLKSYEYPDDWHSISPKIPSTKDGLLTAINHVVDNCKSHIRQAEADTLKDFQTFSPDPFVSGHPVLLKEIKLLRELNKIQQKELDDNAKEIDELNDAVDKAQETLTDDLDEITGLINELKEVRAELDGVKKIESVILPSHISNKIVEHEDITCIVCMDDLNIDNVAISKCGHNYCNDCIGIIISRDDNSKCAECRSPFFNVKENPVILLSPDIDHIDELPDVDNQNWYQPQVTLTLPVIQDFPSNQPRPHPSITYNQSREEWDEMINRLDITLPS